MTRWKNQAARNLVPFAALTAVVAFASPAAAADSTTTVQASPSAVTIGQPVTLTATVTCPVDPSAVFGMTFWDGAVMLNPNEDPVPVPASGEVVFPASLSSVGTHKITAAYSGNGVADGKCGASFGETTVVVSAAPVPPTPPSGLCLLFCFNFGDIHKEVNFYHAGRPYKHHAGRPSEHHDY